MLSKFHIGLAFRVKRYKNSLILKINAARFTETSEQTSLTRCKNSSPSFGQCNLLCTRIPGSLLDATTEKPVQPLPTKTRTKTDGRAYSSYLIVE